MPAGSGSNLTPSFFSASYCSRVSRAKCVVGTLHRRIGRRVRHHVVFLCNARCARHIDRDVVLHRHIGTSGLLHVRCSCLAYLRARAWNERRAADGERFLREADDRSAELTEWLAASTSEQPLAQPAERRDRISHNRRLAAASVGASRARRAGRHRRA